MWRVRCASRLHLGLLSLPASQECWPDRTGSPRFPARRFGGVGVMIDSPGLVLRVEAATEFEVHGPEPAATRARDFLRKVCLSLPSELPSIPLPPRRILLESCPREHVGLGTGTQLGLAMARGLSASWGLEIPAARLARWVGRGKRSALGIHGFEQGGFLVEAGKRENEPLSPLVARQPLPEDWRILFVVPPGEIGRHGPAEQTSFEKLTASRTDTEILTRLVLLGMLPALATGDLAGFSEAVHDFNARVGEWFASEQGNIYASATLAGLIDFLGEQGVRGVGQSSWGPGVFAFVADADRARSLERSLRSLPGGEGLEITVARPANSGAQLEGDDTTSG